MTTTKRTRNDKPLPQPIAGPVGEGFVPLFANRLIYKAEQCQTHPLQGFLLTRLAMPPVGGELEWSALIVRATQPSVGVDRQGAVRPIMRGDEVLVPVTHMLDCNARIEVISRSVEWTAELYIKPTIKVSIGGGQTLWHYDARMAPPRKRTWQEAAYNVTSDVDVARFAQEIT